MQSENILIVGHDRKTWRSYVVASVLVIVALGCWMIYMEYAVQDRPIAVAEKAATPKPVAAIPAMPTPPATPVLQAPLAAPAVPQVAAPESATTPTHPSATKLGMAFTEQSWVSVTEHDGKEIFNKNQPAGSQVTIDGNPPFSVVIGNATGVQLIYHDKPVDLEPHTRANVARLTLE
ncbi:cytoskeleton protein RodZ [mine drainage metagenome]|uniref:Cytoskeleton protein RodZ n=1 Tax=mine drainage metagenome TaxID=410659 RepID=A0A1J5QC95_9ZZZZ